ncbi:MAG: hypothetical protein CL840_00960 [Crocinitomicaceae bacterium]|nr:hypothetical protein [Crocinitomicaceae bacterium]|tara:strand:- start:85624 stop:85971 length:348 start_codon:yes stop_codon:yes gene_type:complete
MLGLWIGLGLSLLVNIVMAVLVVAKIKSEKESIQALVELSERELHYVKKLMKQPVLQWDDIPNADRDTIARLVDLEWLMQFNDGGVIAGRSTRYLGVKAGIFWEQNEALFNTDEK